jgi:hypothetical protein
MTSKPEPMRRLPAKSLPKAQREEQRNQSWRQPNRTPGALRSPIKRGVDALDNRTLRHQLLPFGTELDRAHALETALIGSEITTRYTCTVITFDGNHVEVVTKTIFAFRKQAKYVA